MLGAADGGLGAAAAAVLALLAAFLAVLTAFLAAFGEAGHDCSYWEGRSRAGRCSVGAGGMLFGVDVARLSIWIL